MKKHIAGQCIPRGNMGRSRTIHRQQVFGGSPMLLLAAYHVMPKLTTEAATI